MSAPARSEVSDTPIWDEIRSRRPDPFREPEVPKLSKRQWDRLWKRARRTTKKVCEELGIDVKDVR